MCSTQNLVFLSTFDPISTSILPVRVHRINFTSTPALLLIPRGTSTKDFPSFDSTGMASDCGADVVFVVDFDFDTVKPLPLLFSLGCCFLLNFLLFFDDVWPVWLKPCGIFLAASLSAGPRCFPLASYYWLSVLPSCCWGYCVLCCASDVFFLSSSSAVLQFLMSLEMFHWTIVLASSFRRTTSHF